MIAMKVLKDDLWKELSASEFTGFSIEGFFNQPIVQSAEDIEAEKKILKIKKLLTYIN